MLPLSRLRCEVRNRNVDNEAGSGNNLTSHFNNPVSHFSRLTSKRAFSLIELLIVISLFGLAASLITAAYLSFERNQRLKSAALALKNDLRLAQNQAHTGDKGSDSVCGTDANLYQNVVLIGWYITISRPNSNSYNIYAYCNNSGLPATPYLGKTATLPNGITVSNFDTVGGTCTNLSGTINSINILFQPLTSDARFYDGGQTPPFNDSYRYGSGCTFEITLSGNGLSYLVDVSSNGEINEKKP